MVMGWVTKLLVHHTLFLIRAGSSSTPPNVLIDTLLSSFSFIGLQISLFYQSKGCAMMNWVSRKKIFIYGIECIWVCFVQENKLQ
jgi:hypothetical protein